MATESPTKLDLHGIRHEDVRDLVIRFIEAHWQSGHTVEIITGHSSTMKNLVESVLKEYELDYQIGEPWNQGFIKAFL